LEISMQLRSTLLAALTAVVGIGALGAGPASAHKPVGPMYDATFSGPAGVVWAGQCPALLYEDDNAWLPELCRPHGSAQPGFLLDQGITSVRYATATGQTVWEATFSPTAWSGTTYIQAGTSPENVILDPNRPFSEACPVVDGRLIADQCVKSGAFTPEEEALQRSIATAKASDRATAAKKATKKSAKAKKHAKKAVKHHR
jgi:hypothetical protein